MKYIRYRNSNDPKDGCERVAVSARESQIRWEHRGRDNGLERFLLRLAIGVVLVVVLVMLLREP